MGNPTALPCDDLVARPHHVFAGAQLELSRPSNLGQKLPDIHRARGKGRNWLVQRHHAVIAHSVEPNGSRRYRDWVTVLDPEDDLLAGGRCRQAGIAVGRPGIGVMGCRQRLVTAAAAPPLPRQKCRVRI